MTKTYTDAPAEYDGFGTRTLAVIGITKDRFKKTVRLVETPDEHVEWQRGRYMSGNHMSAGENLADFILSQIDRAE